MKIFNLFLLVLLLLQSSNPYDVPYGGLHYYYNFRKAVLVNGSACQIADCALGTVSQFSSVCDCYGEESQESVSFLPDDQGIVFTCLLHFLFCFIF